MRINERYKNKYFSVLGDSISTFEGYSTPKEAVFYDREHKLAASIISPTQTWWGQVIERLGGTLLVNDSWSGSTVYRNPEYQVPSYACSDERTSSLHKNGIFPDVILVFMGTNDWGTGVQVTENGKRTADNCAIFSNAYRVMLEKLKKNYPNAEIWCMTLPISRCSARENFAFPYYFGGRHISEYNQAICACAKELNCRVIDLYSYRERHDTMDTFHPNASGMATIANAVIEALDEA